MVESSLCWVEGCSSCNAYIVEVDSRSKVNEMVDNMLGAIERFKLIKAEGHFNTNLTLKMIERFSPNDWFDCLFVVLETEEWRGQQ